MEKTIKNYELLSKVRPSNASLFLNCTKALETEVIKPKEYGDAEKEVMARGREKHKLVEDILKKHYEDKENIINDIENLKDDNLKAYVETLITRYPASKYNVRIEKSIPIPILKRYGTVDFLAYNDKELHIIDLKTGFVDVEPVNKQNILYAVSMLQLLKELKVTTIEKVVLGIFQHNILNSVEVSKETLKYEWKKIAASVVDILTMNLKYKVGPWCGWCSNKTCKAIVDKAIELSEFDLQPNGVKELIEIHRILDKKVKQVKEELNKADNVEDFGFKKYYRSSKVVTNKKELIDNIIKYGDLKYLNVSTKASEKYSDYFKIIRKPYLKEIK
jgi:hypothetical protein